MRVNLSVTHLAKFHGPWPILWPDLCPLKIGHKLLFWPLAHACSSILWKVIFSRCNMWYTCLWPCGPPGDGLDGLSDPKNPYFDTSNMSAAQTNQKLASYWCAKYLWFMTGAQGSNKGTTGVTGDNMGPLVRSAWWLQAPQNMLTIAYIMICEHIKNLW